MASRGGPLPSPASHFTRSHQQGSLLMASAPKPSKRFSEYVPKILACGHWEATGKIVGNHLAEIRSTTGAESIFYGLHDGGNDLNSARNFATKAQRVCGCKFIEPRRRNAGRSTRTTQAAINGRATTDDRNDQVRAARRQALVNRARALKVAWEFASLPETRNELVKVLNGIAKMDAVAEGRPWTFERSGAYGGGRGDIAGGRS